MATRTSELRLTIEHGSEPIAGSLDLPDGHTMRFEGYLQLVGFLEDLREDLRDHPRTDGDDAE